MSGLKFLGLWAVFTFLAAFFHEFLPSVLQIWQELRQRRVKDGQKPPSDGPVG